jgi:FtsH-binding integral membrane protein
MADIPVDVAGAPAAGGGAGANPAASKKSLKSAYSFGAFFFLVIAILIPCRVSNPAWAWVGCLLAMIAFSGVVGAAINHRVDGLIRRHDD